LTEEVLLRTALRLGERLPGRVYEEGFVGEGDPRRSKASLPRSQRCRSRR
jgi:hypothetical protein